MYQETCIGLSAYTYKYLVKLWLSAHLSLLCMLMWLVGNGSKFKKINNIYDHITT